MNKNFDAERVSTMENEYEKALNALGELRSAVDGFLAVRDSFEALETYYRSPQWLEDYDSAVPPYRCKCGVLSQDGLHMLFSEKRELLRLISALSEKGGNFS